MDQAMASTIIDALNTTALAAIAYLLAKGYLVPMSVVEKFMLAPLNDRIAALEKVSSRKDDQSAELQRMQAEAIKSQGEAIGVLHRHLPGGD